MTKKIILKLDKDGLEKLNAGEAISFEVDGPGELEKIVVIKANEPCLLN